MGFLLKAIAFLGARFRPPAGVSSGASQLLDSSVLEETARSLRDMLVEVDELSRALPDDARPIGIAARELVEHALAECQKPFADATRLTRDMEQVGLLAHAMRERLLLNPKSHSLRLKN